MFRAGKFNVQHCVKRLANGTLRPMSMAKRLIDASCGSHMQRQPVPGSTGNSLSATAQVTSAGGNPPAMGSHHSEDGSSEVEQTSRWPRKIFSGIQPTGALHLGNYLGAVRKWTQLQNSRDDVTLCIVDMHSITLPHNPPVLREHIFEMAATLLACGIDPSKSTLFVQSAVLEHCEFNWILSSLTTMPRLAQLPQFKDKSRTLRDVPLGLYVYPVLQAADIMLYKATHVPVGADQLQHIQLAQHLARTFNTRYGDLFPVCHALIEGNEGSRVLSLRDPTKKMSKSELSPKATINLSDPPDAIAEKIKKAVTDFTSDISYNPQLRPGVSNLVSIHAQVTGQSIKSVVDEAKLLDTARYKERVAEAVIEHLRPIREQIQLHLSKRNELIYMLEIGAEKARQIAQQTMADVKQRLGLGTNAQLPAPVLSMPSSMPDSAAGSGQHNSRMTASQRLAKGVLLPHINDHSQPHLEQRGDSVQLGGNAGEPASGDLEAGVAGDVNQPKPLLRRTVVPLQSMRVEKQRNKGPPKHIFKLDTLNVPNIGFRAPPPSTLVPGMELKQHSRPHLPPPPGGLGFAPLPHVAVINSTSAASAAASASEAAAYLGYVGAGQHARPVSPSAVASITSAANAVNKQQELAGSLVHSAYYKAAVAAYNNNGNESSAASSSNNSPAIIYGNSKSGSSRVEQEEEDEEEQEQEDGDGKDAKNAEL